MPATTSSPPARPRLKVALAIVATAAAVAGGCRALRCQKVSDESVATARQLSLAGLDAQQRGQWDRAEALFSEAIGKCPTDERARCGLAESLWRRGARSEAIAQMQEAARLSGHDPEHLVRLGQMYRAVGNLAFAERHAQLAIAANPKLASAWTLRGQVEQARGQTKEALASFHRALSYQQPLVDAQLAISEIYLAERRPQRALATIQALAASFPPGQVPTDVLLRESAALRALERPQDAARLLAAAAAQGNQSVDLLYELALAQYLSGDIAAAQQAVAAALRREPQHAGCLALREQLPEPAAAVARTAGPPIRAE